MKNNLFLLLAFIGLLACDKVDDPYPEVQEQSFALDGDTQFIIPDDLGIQDTNELRNFILSRDWKETNSPNNTTKRFITLEEFTGQKCINCLPASKEIVRLDSIYEEQLIPIAIHAGTFARPDQNPNSLYTQDLRDVNEMGDEYAKLFGIPSYPQGIVSRLNGAEVTNKDSWQTKIISIKDDAPKASLNITNYYSDSIQVLRSQIEIEWNESLNENYNLQLYIVEDSILGNQKNGFQDVLNYNHRHVLRKVVNGKFGKSLGSANQGSTLSFQYFIPFESSWKVEHLELVAFIFDTDASSYEVIQANAAYFKK